MGPIRIQQAFLPFSEGERSFSALKSEDSLLGVWKNRDTSFALYRTRSGKVRSVVVIGGKSLKIQSCWIKSSFPLDKPVSYPSSKAQLIPFTKGEGCLVRIEYGLKGGKGRLGNIGSDDRVQRRTPTDPLLRRLQEAMDQAALVRGKDIVAFIGATGSGKSTIVNHLLGVELVRREDGRVVARNSDEERAKIGHRPTASQTEFATAYIREGDPNSWVDCGGIFDTRGLSTELVVAASMKYTLELAKSVKVVLCIPYSELDNAKAGPLIRLVKLVVRDFFVDQCVATPSLAVLFTKLPYLGAGRLASRENVLEKLREIRDDLGGSSDATRRGLVDFLLRNEGRYVGVYDPLSAESRTALLRQVNALAPVANPCSAFQHVCSNDALVQVYERVNRIAKEVIEYYRTRVNDYVQYELLSASYTNVHAASAFIEGLIARRIKVNIVTTEMNYTTELIPIVPKRNETVIHTFQSKIVESENRGTLCLGSESVVGQAGQMGTKVSIQQKIITITPSSGPERQDTSLASIRELLCTKICDSMKTAIIERRKVAAAGSSKALEDVEVLDQLLKLSNDASLVQSALMEEYRKEKANYEKAVRAANPNSDPSNIMEQAMLGIRGGRFE